MRICKKNESETDFNNGYRPDLTQKNKSFVSKKMQCSGKKYLLLKPGNRPLSIVQRNVIMAIDDACRNKHSGTGNS